MSHKSNKIAVICSFSFAFLLFLFLIISPKFESIAQNDGSAPVLEDFALSTNEIDSDTEEVLTVYVRVSDNSGISSISGSLRPIAYDEETNSETQSLSLTFALAPDCSGLGGILNLEGLTGCGDEYDGVYSATVAFPYGSTLGEWKVQEIYIGATNGYAAFGYNDLETLYGVGSATIDNIGIVEDTEGPEILDYSFDQTDIDTSSAEEVLVLTVRAADEISGIPEEISLSFMSSYEPHFAEFSLELQVGECAGIDADIDMTGLTGCGDLNDGIFIGTATIPKWSASGDWIVENMFADNLGNIGTLPVSPVSFTNSATIEDIAPPVITSLSMTPAKFDASIDAVTITLTVGIEDDVSGVASGDMTIASIMDEGNGIQSTGFVLISGDEFDGVYELTIEIPKDSYVGLWAVGGVNATDNRGNWLPIQGFRNLSIAFPDLEFFLINEALSGEVTIQQDWILENWVYRDAQHNLVWPKISVKFGAGTIITKQGGGEFGLHRMISERYDIEQYASLSAFLTEANQTLTTDLEDCALSEGCTASQLNSSNFVGQPVHIIKMGIPGLGLTFSEPVTITVRMTEADLGKSFTIQTFDTGTNAWINQTTCVVAMVEPSSTEHGGDAYGEIIPVAYPACRFATDHASFFSANVLGVETEQLPGVPSTGLGGTYSWFERLLGWLR